MLASIALVMELMALAPKLMEAGINISGLWTKARAALDANAAPGDAAWDEADRAVNSLMARALDPATDSR